MEFVEPPIEWSSQNEMYDYMRSSVGSWLMGESPSRRLCPIPFLSGSLVRSEVGSVDSWLKVWAVHS